MKGNGDEAEVQLIGRESRWGSVGEGKLGASGAPGHGGVTRWAAAGADVVVTLQRQSEMSETVIEQCHESGIEWIHLPLRGRDSLTNPTEEDNFSIRRVSLIVDFLKSGKNVVVHCSAGMHRTGFVCYLVMRLSGLSATESLQILHGMRAVTYEQILLASRKHPKTIQELAEGWLTYLNQKEG